MSDDVARIEPFAGGVANDVWSLRVDGHLAVGRLGARSDADLDLVLPHNAADLDDSAYDVAAQASAAWEPQSAGTDDDAAKRLSPGSMVTRRILS